MLKTLFGGSPRWQSPDPAVRLGAVAELDADDLALVRLATEDPDAQVRAAAASRLTVPAQLGRALKDTDPKVRAAAADAWARLLREDIPLDTPLEVVAAAVRDDSPEAFRQAAISVALNDLRAWLGSVAPLSAKLAAIAACNDAEQLEALHLAVRDSDKRLGKACHERAQALALRDRTAQEADVLLTQLQHWTEAADVPLSKLVEVQRAWAKLSPDAERQARFQALTKALQLKMQNDALARRLHEQLAMQIAGLALKSKKASELPAEELATLAAEATRAQSSPVLDAGLAQQLQAVHAAIAAELELRERHALGERLLAERPIRPETAAPAEPPSAARGADSATAVGEPSAASLQPPAEVPAQLAADDLAAREAAWRARWDAWIASVDPATRERFERRIHVLEAAVAPEPPKRERAPVEQASAEELLAANAELAQLADLIAGGDVRGARAAASGLFKRFTGRRYPKLEYDRLHELDREVKRLESWLKWSDAQARDALFARLEAIKASPPAVETIVKEVRAIQEEWKTLDKKHGGAPKPKWERFNALCREAYAPAKAHFDEIKKARTENASARGKVIERMNALADEATAAHASGMADWSALEKRKLELLGEWRKAGGVANADWKALDARFDEAIEKLEKIFDAAREPEIARRRRLIALAEEQAKLPPSKAVTEATIALQRRWSAERVANSPHLRRKDEQQLWGEFKRHTDQVFKARDGQRDALRAQFTEAGRVRLGLIDEVKALAQGTDAKAVEAALTQLRGRWREAPMVEREKARDLERKFDEAVTGARRRIGMLARGSLIEAMKTSLAQLPSTEASDGRAAAMVIDAELIAGIESPPEVASARRMQQLRWLSERRQLPTTAEGRMQALRTLLGALSASGARLTLGERERLVRAIESSAV